MSVEDVEPATTTVKDDLKPGIGLVLEAVGMVTNLLASREIPEEEEEVDDTG